jgi:hypothetical protein
MHAGPTDQRAPLCRSPPDMACRDKVQLLLPHGYVACGGDDKGRVRNRLRSVMRRVLLIGYQARSPKTRAGLVESYRQLMTTTRATLRDAATMVRRIGQRVDSARPAVRQSLLKAQNQLRALRPVVQRVLAQTRARIFGGDTHVPDKVLSIFEPHTETIRKGKIATPNEFGKLVTIQESEHQIITGYEVHAKRPADSTLWTAALDRHQAMFGRAPDRAAADRGSGRRATSKRRWIVASVESSCHAAVSSPRLVEPINDNAGSGVGSDGASARKAGSAS